MYCDLLVMAIHSFRRDDGGIMNSFQEFRMFTGECSRVMPGGNFLAKKEKR